MGNTIPSCCNPNSSSPVKLFFWDGTTKMFTGKKLAGELMFQFPDRIICHADSFYIGHPIQALSIDDRLVKGETYFILPVNPFAGQILSTTSLATLSPAPKCKLPINSCNNPFQYIKGRNGRMMMKVSPEFMMRIISGGGEQGCNSSKSPLCSTPELWKQYKLLVGSREQVWSPKLETISECRKGRLSPCGLLRSVDQERWNEEESKPSQQRLEVRDGRDQYSQLIGGNDPREAVGKGVREFTNECSRTPTNNHNPTSKGRESRMQSASTKTT